jgi:hypothetical protein
VQHLDAAVRAAEHAQQPLRLEAALLVGGVEGDAAPQLGALAEALEVLAGAEERHAAGERGGGAAGPAR